MTSKFQHRIKCEIISGKTPDPKEHDEEISCATDPTEVHCTRLQKAEGGGAREEGEGGRVLRGGGDEGVRVRQSERERERETKRRREGRVQTQSQTDRERKVVCPPTQLSSVP